MITSVPLDYEKARVNEIEFLNKVERHSYAHSS
jgi:hypothetical protein